MVETDNTPKAVACPKTLLEYGRSNGRAASLSQHQSTPSTSSIGHDRAVVEEKYTYLIVNEGTGFVPRKKGLSKRPALHGCMDLIYFPDLAKSFSLEFSTAGRVCLRRKMTIASSLRDIEMYELRQGYHSTQ